VLATIAGLFAASILLGFVFPFGNPKLGAPGHSPQASNQSSIPAGVRAILIAKCADCHSLETRVPVYAHLAPASWLIERDVVRARNAMNLSMWDENSKEDQLALIEEVAHVASKREMPPYQYLLLHWNARLTTSDVETITEWAQSTLLAGQGPQGNAPLQGDADRGKQVFEKRCTGCHALDRDREGPHLSGVYGRTAGAVSGFDYSDALKNSHIVWSETTLERWLTDPQTMVPGVDMDFRVAKPDERADVIAFLKKQSRQASSNQPR